MTISKTGLAGRWYMEWVRRGGTPPPTMNLCHFVRVLMIWAPLRFLFKNRTDDSGCPALLWVITGTALVLMSVGLVGYGLYSMVVNWDWEVAKALGLIFAGVLVVILLVAGTKVASEELEEPLRIYRDYHAAKQSRICPLVRWEDPR